MLKEGRLEAGSGAGIAAKSAPLRHLIRGELLRGILSGRYRPGQRLLELAVAKEFATSQGPVREAFRELEATGLVVNIPRRGTYVADHVAAMRIAAAAGNVEQLVEDSVAFHRAILQSSGNQLLLSMWSALHIETRTTITLLAEGIDLVAVADSHQPIVEAMAAGDAEGAARLARLHQDYFEALPVALAGPAGGG